MTDQTNTVSHRRQEDTMTHKLGIGYKFLIFCCFTMIFGYVMYDYGKQQGHITNVDNRLQVMHEDSKQGLKITEETKKLDKIIEEEVNDFEEPIVDDNGYLSDDFMQLFHAQVNRAKCRGDETVSIHCLTSTGRVWKNGMLEDSDVVSEKSH